MQLDIQALQERCKALEAQLAAKVQSAVAVTKDELDAFLARLTSLEESVENALKGRKKP